MRPLLVALACTVACSHIGPDRRPTDADVALDVAGELEHAHRYAIARSELAAIADIVGPAEGEELRLRACRTFGLEGDTQSERACYAEAAAPDAQSDDRDDLATQREQEARAARALLTTDDATERFIVGFADTEAARKALIALLEDEREQGGCPAQLALLMRLETAITDPMGNVLDAEIAVKRAELLFGDCRDDDDTRGARCHRARRGHCLLKRTGSTTLSGSSVTPPSAQGKADEAVAAYSRIIDARSDAWIFGSNDSLFLDDAWLAKGLLLEKLGRAEAASTLHDLINARPTSRLRDDAERALQRMGS